MTEIEIRKEMAEITKRMRERGTLTQEDNDRLLELSNRLEQIKEASGNNSGTGNSSSTSAPAFSTSNANTGKTDSDLKTSTTGEATTVWSNNPTYDGPDYNIIQPDDSLSIQEAKAKAQKQWIEQRNNSSSSPVKTGLPDVVRVDSTGTTHPSRDNTWTKRNNFFSGENTGSSSIEPSPYIHRQTTSDYIRTYTSYSGHDMVCTFEIPLQNGGAISSVIGAVQTITYSIHNEKMPVRVLGDMNMKGMVFGNRTIAGSMVFTVFDRHWAQQMTQEYLKAIGSSAHALMDEMPGFNITISMANEYGDVSRLALYGVSFVNEGQVMSIQDIYTENTYQFYAKDLDYLTNVVSYNRSSTKNRANELRARPQEMPDDPSVVAPIDVPTPYNSPAKTGNEDLYSNIDRETFNVYGLDNPNIFTGKTYAELSAEIDEKYRNEVLSSIEEQYQRGEISSFKKKAMENAAKSVWLEARKKAESYYLEVV